MVVIGAIFTAIILFQPNHKEEQELKIQEIAQEEILDDCTDEYEEMEYDNTVKVNTRRRKRSEERRVGKECRL